MTMQAVIRVLIADDHDMVRQGLAQFLDVFDDLELVGQAANGLDALRLCDELRPDVVLMDLVMPQMDGVAATRAIRQAHPHIQVLALTSFTEDALIQSVLEAGAIGYLLKNIAIDKLAQAIRAAHAGDPSMSPEATRMLIRARTQPAAPSYNLSDRELDVLALLVKGLANRQIADRLTISQSTVRFHVSSILAKLAVSNRTEAATLAIQQHLVK